MTMLYCQLAGIGIDPELGTLESELVRNKGNWAQRIGPEFRRSLATEIELLLRIGLRWTDIALVSGRSLSVWSHKLFQGTFIPLASFFFSPDRLSRWHFGGTFKKRNLVGVTGYCRAL